MVGIFLTIVSLKMLLQLITFGPVRGTVSSSWFSNRLAAEETREKKRKEQKIFELSLFSSLLFWVAKRWRILSKRSTWLVGGLSFLGFQGLIFFFSYTFCAIKVINFLRKDA